MARGRMFELDVHSVDDFVRYGVCTLPEYCGQAMRLDVFVARPVASQLFSPLREFFTVEPNFAWFMPRPLTVRFCEDSANILSVMVSDGTFRSARPIAEFVVLVGDLRLFACYDDFVDVFASELVAPALVGSLVDKGIVGVSDDRWRTR